MLCASKDLCPHVVLDAPLVLPSRPLQLFCEEQRPLLKEAHPEAGFGELCKLLGAAWKDEAHKEDYAARAEVSARRVGARGRQTCVGH